MNNEFKTENISKMGKEQLEQLKKQVEELEKPKILTSIKMRKGEEDIRQLPSADKDQLNYRLMCDFWMYLRTMNDSLAVIQLLLIEMAKKLNVDVDKKFEEWTNDIKK